MKKLLLSGFLLFSLVGMAIQEIPTTNAVAALLDGREMPEEWTEYTTVDGVKIEYKMKQCESDKMRPQNLVLFRYTNTTNQELTISWVTKVFRNGHCVNCNSLDSPEHAHTLTIPAGEVVEGDGASKENKEVYIFGNFINLIPGMTDQRLTDFELVDLTVQ
jgi:hypothetical protein